MRSAAAALILMAGSVSVGAGEISTPFPALSLPPNIDGLAIVSEVRPKGRSNYLDLVLREAERQGLPAPIADAVANVESGYDPGAVGAVGEIGLMQVRPETAAMLGHVGPLSELFIPETNVRYGVAYLAGAWRLSGGDLCLALAKYRAGHGETRVSARSAAYCLRARAVLAGLGTSAAPLVGRGVIKLSARPWLGVRQAGAASARPRPSSSIIRRLWAEHSARVRQIETRISRIMSGG